MKHAKKAVKAASNFPALNPDQLVFEGTHLSASDAAIWFEDQAKLWAEQFGGPIEMTRGVFSRWLLFFARFQGHNVSETVLVRFGRHLTQE
jgi:hypothetical protein